MLNSNEKPAAVKENLQVVKGKVWTVPATKIALEILGVPITNTALLGAVFRATYIVSLENIERTLKTHFRPDLAENISVVKEAYEKATMED